MCNGRYETIQELFYGKFLTVAIVVLFIGAGVVPSISSDVSSLSAGNTLYVGGSGNGNYSIIQSAINDASDGDTVYVYNGTYYEIVVVDKTINLTGENRDSTIIDGNEITIKMKIAARLP